MGSRIVNTLVLAVIIPLMFGIRRSFSSTKPFCPPTIKGNEVETNSFPPSISLDALADVPFIVNSVQEFTKLKPSKPANIPGTIPPL